MALLYDFTIAEDALLSELKMCQLLSQVLLKGSELFCLGDQKYIEN